MIFLDTSAIYALADANDPNHARAVDLFDDALKERVLVHSYVIVESVALLQNRLGLPVALQFLRDSEAFTVHWVASADHRRAVRLLGERGRRGLSLVDCVSFLVMRRHSLAEALAFDPDFEMEGFQLYQGQSG